MRGLTIALVAVISVSCVACSTGPEDSSGPDDRSFEIVEYSQTLEASQSRIEYSPPDEDAVRAHIRERLRWKESTPFTGVPASGSAACAAMLIFLDRHERRAQESGDTLWSREQAAETVVASMSADPGFLAAPESHQTEVVEGIRSATAGGC